MQQIELDEAKTQMASLLQSALDGEKIIISKDGQALLLIMRVSEGGVSGTLYRIDNSGTKPHRQSGSAKGLISMSDDFDEPLEDFTEYMQ